MNPYIEVEPELCEHCFHNKLTPGPTLCHQHVLLRRSIQLPSLEKRPIVYLNKVLGEIQEDGTKMDNKIKKKIIFHTRLTIIL